MVSTPRPISTGGIALEADWPERADACTAIARINRTGERLMNTPSTHSALATIGLTSGVPSKV